MPRQPQLLSDYAMQQKEEEILRLLRKFPRPVSTKEIIKNCGERFKQPLMPLIYDLSDRGLILKVVGSRLQAWRINNKPKSFPDSYSDNPNPFHRINSKFDGPLPSFDDLLNKKSNDNSIDLSSQTSTGPPLPPHMLTKNTPSRVRFDTSRTLPSNSHNSRSHAQSFVGNEDCSGRQYNENKSAGGPPLPPHMLNTPNRQEREAPGNYVESDNNSGRQYNENKSAGGPPLPPHMLNTPNRQEREAPGNYVESDKNSGRQYNENKSAGGRPLPPHMLNTPNRQEREAPGNYVESDNNSGRQYNENKSAGGRPLPPHMLNTPNRQEREAPGNYVESDNNSGRQYNENKSAGGRPLPPHMLNTPNRQEREAPGNYVESDNNSGRQYNENKSAGGRPLPPHMLNTSNRQEREAPGNNEMNTKSQHQGNFRYRDNINTARTSLLRPAYLGNDRNSREPLQTIHEDIREDDEDIVPSSKSPLQGDKNNIVNNTNTKNDKYNPQRPYIPPSEPPCYSSTIGIKECADGDQDVPLSPTPLLANQQLNSPLNTNNNYTVESSADSSANKDETVSTPLKGPPPPPHLLTAPPTGTPDINVQTLQENRLPLLPHMSVVPHKPLLPHMLHTGTPDINVQTLQENRLPLLPHMSVVPHKPLLPHMLHTGDHKEHAPDGDYPEPPNDPPLLPLGTETQNISNPNFDIQSQESLRRSTEPSLPPHLPGGRDTSPASIAMSPSKESHESSTTTQNKPNSITNIQSAEELCSPKISRAPPLPPHVLGGKGGPPLPPHLLTGTDTQHRGIPPPFHSVAPSRCVQRPPDISHQNVKPIGRSCPSNISRRNQNVNVQQPVAMLSCETFNALNKNPISALNEMVQKQGKEVLFEVLNEAKGGRNKFTVAVKIGNQMFDAVSAPNMKEARRDASDAALRVGTIHYIYIGRTHMHAHTHTHIDTRAHHQ